MDALSARSWRTSSWSWPELLVMLVMITDINEAMLPGIHDCDVHVIITMKTGKVII